MIKRIQGQNSSGKFNIKRIEGQKYNKISAGSAGGNVLLKTA